MDVSKPRRGRRRRRKERKIRDQRRGAEKEGKGAAMTKRGGVVATRLEGGV